jgi:hypothetical protein
VPAQPLPCCPDAQASHLCDLPHVHQFDLDLYRCDRCSNYWVRAWRAGTGGWEPVSATDAAQMQTLDAAALRAFMKQWSQSFS